MGLVNTYRTHVFNDFSIVLKAAFYGFRRKGNNFIVEEKLPVQINPYSLDELTSSPVNANPNGIFAAMDAAGSTKEYPPAPKRRDKNKSLDIRLVYDIYDEYNVCTNNGMTGLASDISLMDPDFTSLPKLIEYSHNNEMYTLFRWGKINFFGFITDVSCVYNAFSCWGDPLKCDVTVRMDEYKIPEYKAGDCILKALDMTGTSLTAISAIESVSKAAMTAGLALGSIAEEATAFVSLASR